MGRLYSYHADPASGGPTVLLPAEIQNSEGIVTTIQVHPRGVKDCQRDVNVCRQKYVVELEPRLGSGCLAAAALRAMMLKFRFTSVRRTEWKLALINPR